MCIQMTYKTVTVHLDNENTAPALLRAAGQVATEHNAHLVGVCILKPLDLYVSRIAESTLSKELLPLLYKDQLDSIERLKQLFSKETDNQNYASEWRFIDNKIDSIFDLLMQQAAVTDLLVLSRQSERANSSDNNNILEKALIDSPVPVLMVPGDYEGNTVGRHIIAGWSTDSTSSKAIHSALPLLQSAEQVWIHRITSEKKDNELKNSMDIELANILDRHGVRTELSIGSENRQNAGESLLEEAKLRGADTIVAGAFGHSRVRELILGGATKYLLKNSHLPMLMHH